VYFNVVKYFICQHNVVENLKELNQPTPIIANETTKPEQNWPLTAE